MGVEKQVLQAGNGVDFPKKGDTVAMHYTGCLYDSTKQDNHFMGTKYALLSSNLCSFDSDLIFPRFDSSKNPGRGQPLSSPIGVGRLIKGAYPQASRSLCGAPRWPRWSVFHRGSCVLTCVYGVGWDEGVPQMSLGEKAILQISA